jgi:DNA-binding CsgD family transcriptional regulator
MAEVRSEDIYEALFDDEALGRLPQRLADIAGARSALMFWRHHDGIYEVMGSTHFSDRIVGLFPEILPIDLWNQAALSHPNQLIRTDLYVTPQAYERSTAFNEYLRPDGDDTFHCMGQSIITPFGAGVIGLHRGRSAATFDETDQAALGAQMGDVIKVLRLRGELASGRRRADLARGAVNGLGLCVMTVRGDRRILDLNPAAEDVLRCASGLMDRAGFLTATTVTAANRLAGAVAAATARDGASATSFIVERGTQAAEYLVTVAPMKGAALVVFRNPDAEDGSLVERLRSVYGLTAAEATVAIDLARGRSVADLCLLRGAQPNTLRKQIKIVAGKMGVNRQSEIVARVVGLPELRM